MTPAERLAALPPAAHKIVTDLAAEYRIADPALIMGDYPHRAAVVEARQDAFVLLSAAARAGSWSINDIGGWFGITRAAMSAARAKSARTAL